MVEASSPHPPPLSLGALLGRAYPQWLMGLDESMSAAKSAVAVPQSKTGRPPLIPASGRPTGRAMASVRGF